MTIERWEPIREMISLRDVMSSLLGDSFVRPGAPATTGAAATLPLDVAETESEFVIKASLPGIKPEDVRITIHGGTVTIRGESKSEDDQQGAHWHVRERRVSSLARSLSLSAPINADAATAQFDHGVLTLTLPKSAEAATKQVPVVSASPSPPSSEPPERAAREPQKSGSAKSSKARGTSNRGGKPKPTDNVAAEQAREAQEAETARNSAASSRERMVDIGRGRQQAGRQGQ